MNQILKKQIIKEFETQYSSVDSEGSDHSFDNLTPHIKENVREETFQQSQRKQFNSFYNSFVSNKPNKKSYVENKENNKESIFKNDKIKESISSKMYKQLFSSKGRSLKELAFRLGLNTAHDFTSLNSIKLNKSITFPIRSFIEDSKNEFFTKLSRSTKYNNDFDMLKPTDQCVSSTNIHNITSIVDTNNRAFNKNRTVVYHKGSDPSFISKKKIPNLKHSKVSTKVSMTYLNIKTKSGFSSFDNKTRQMPSNKAIGGTLTKDKENFIFKSITQDIKDRKEFFNLHNKTSFKPEIERLLNSRMSLGKLKADKIIPYIEFYKMEKYFLSSEAESHILNFETNEANNQFRRLIANTIKNKDY